MVCGAFKTFIRYFQLVSYIKTVTFSGVEVLPVHVQAHLLSSNMPTFGIVGLGDKAISESKERVRSALCSIGLALPAKRITINLSPADLIKEGSHFDLPIILGILIGMNVITQAQVDKYVCLGELSLDGKLLNVGGCLPAAMYANSLQNGIICPKVNGSEAAWASEEMEILAPNTLTELISHLTGAVQVPRPQVADVDDKQDFGAADFANVKGQMSARCALEVAASGGHNVLMSGPPGSGKSLLASCFASILPPLTSKEKLECSIINSIAGGSVSGGSGNGGGKIVTKRPFRDPHHSCSVPALVGGGKIAKPGEITLAHNGVLFLDELPEYQRGALESLRQSLETGYVTISRVNSHVTYPAKFILVAAMNPCKCGYLGDSRQCSKAPKCATEYQSRISGPLLDRIDLLITVNSDFSEIFDRADSLNYADSLVTARAKETSAEILQRVIRCRSIQEERYQGFGITTNSQATNEILEKVGNVTPEAQSVMRQAVDKFKLSMRGYVRVLRVARTIADILGEKNVCKGSVHEALYYRQGACT